MQVIYLVHYKVGRNQYSVLGMKLFLFYSLNHSLVVLSQKLRPFSDPKQHLLHMFPKSLKKDGISIFFKALKPQLQSQNKWEHNE